MVGWQKYHKTFIKADGMTEKMLMAVCNDGDIVSCFAILYMLVTGTQMPVLHFSDVLPSSNFQCILYIFAVDYKKAVHTVKKASSDTVRLQKKANKGVL